jgi:thiol-disulfide isomerase/thioredoxin
MGRLPPLGSLCLAAAWFSVAAGLGCRQDPKNSPTRERSEVVKASGSVPDVPSNAPPTLGSGVGPATVPARKLCEGQLARAGREAPRKPIARKAALGARPIGAALPAGKWTWVNLWAAWCAPCKEEMPRLQSFAARLSQTGGELALAFVSLDDDERQLEQFLAEQPDVGVRATFWLREGRERDDWLAAAGLGRDPALPVQLLIDPKGKLRCTVNGAVADQDFAEIAMIVSP